MTNIRIGVVGCGKIGRTHAAAVASLSDVELVGVCDLVPEKAEEVAALVPGVPAFSDVERLLTAGRPDAILVATDHKHHFVPAMQAIDAGVGVLVEKPLTTSLVEAEELVSAAGRAGVALGAIFQRRFFPAAQRMHEAIVDGRLGRVVAAECLAHLGRDRRYFARDPWRGSWVGEGGGALLNQAIHMIDMLSWMLGEPTEVYGRWGTLKHSEYIDVEDVAGGVVTYANGAIATIQALTTFENGLAAYPSDTTSRRAPGFQLVVHGSTGHTVSIIESPELDQATTGIWSFDGEESSAQRWREEEAGRPGFPGFHAEQIRDFVASIREGRSPAVTGRDALVALQIVKGIYLSQDRGLPIALPMSEPDRLAADGLTERAA